MDNNEVNKGQEYIWSNDPPKSIPFPQSKDFDKILFTGRHAVYAKADTWYPSWAADGNLYSPYMDGHVMDENGNQVNHRDSGVAKIEGDHPLDLKVTAILPRSPKDVLGYEGMTRIVSVDGNSYDGIYACANILYNNIWYIGAELRDGHRARSMDGFDYDWISEGPFTGFRVSTDFGQSWQESPNRPYSKDSREKIGISSIFPEPKYYHGPVKIGAPHVVDFGKNMEHSPDGFIYMVAHGVSDQSSSRFIKSMWNHGDEIYLIKVRPGIENINNIMEYQFFSGYDYNGKPIWSTRWEHIKPLIDWKYHTGCVTITYNAPLNKYFMVVGDGSHSGNGPFNTYILEADQITGPWKLVTYMRNFGPQAYFCNIPSKFISKDGRKMWLCYSANWKNWEIAGPPKPTGSCYSMTLQEIVI